MKVVIDTVGFFSLSIEAIEYMAVKGHPQAKKDLRDHRRCRDDDYHYFRAGKYERTDPILIEAITTLGRDASQEEHSCLKVVEIPDDVNWEIYYYDDGGEKIVEKHREWY